MRRFHQLANRRRNLGGGKVTEAKWLKKELYHVAGTLRCRWVCSCCNGSRCEILLAINDEPEQCMKEGLGELAQDGQTTSDSGVYRNDMFQYNPSINSATKTASFSVDASIGIYYIDCTAGNITATFDMTASTNKTVTFIRIDASTYVFKIAGYVGGVPVKLEGTDSPIDLGMVQYESKPINTNGTVFYIV